MVIVRKFEPINEFWKYSGVMWQVLKMDDEFAVASQDVYCVDCFDLLDSGLKCEGCGKQHKMPASIQDLAERAGQSYQAAKRRKEYTVAAPQVGEKIADVDLDLSSNRFMNVKLEKRKNNEQVVVTVGEKGAKNKAQIFIDLAKAELRHDSSDEDPAQHVKSVSLETEGEKTTKHYAVDDDGEAPHVELMEEPVTWASNYGGYGASFRAVIKVDNFNGKLNYITSVKLSGTNANNTPFITNRFTFEGNTANLPQRIGLDEMPIVTVFMSFDHENHRPMPDLDRDSTKLIVQFRDKTERVVPVRIAQS